MPNFGLVWTGLTTALSDWSAGAPANGRVGQPARRAGGPDAYPAVDRRSSRPVAARGSPWQPYAVCLLRLGSGRSGRTRRVPGCSARLEHSGRPLSWRRLEWRWPAGLTASPQRGFKYSSGSGTLPRQAGRAGAAPRVESVAELLRAAGSTGTERIGSDANLRSLSGCGGGTETGRPRAGNQSAQG